MQVNTKFNVGDKVWFMHDDKVNHQKITSILVRIGLEIYPPEESPTIGIVYNFNKITKDEQSVFPTKEELIASL